MKFDMHCHTKEGSIDGKVGLDQYIEILKSKGFQGMLITDHNSYDAYRYWKKEIKGKRHKDFVVLKGIEYDTCNAGHMLVIMPEGVKPRILEMRGMPVAFLITVVHAFGGIIGPAHPCGEKYMSLTNTGYYRKNKNIVKRFDFVETFNACETPASNQAAKELAQAYDLPGFGGSDAHREDCVGLAYTKLEAQITTESGLISYIKEKAPVRCGGCFYNGTTKEKIGKMNQVLVYSFWVYNKAAGLMKVRKRRKQSRYMVLRKDGNSSYRIN